MRESEDPSREMLRSAKDDPKCGISKTDNADPKRLNDLNANDEPIWQMSRSDTADPSFAIPSTENVDPIRMNCRIDKVEPSFEKSRTLIVSMAPYLMIPTSARFDPSRTLHLTESEEPKVIQSMTAQLRPIRENLRNDRALP